MIINKPFRFLKNIMRFYEREANNIYKEVKQLEVSKELWIKAANNFKNRGLTIPIYENHDETIVVGTVYKIEAMNDGLYVVEHSLNERGIEIIKNKQYPIPSGDFVLHYDNNNNLSDIEVFAVSLVNNEGAKDVEAVTMSKENKNALSHAKVLSKKSQNLNKPKLYKEERKMDREIILEHLLDYDFLSQLPEDVIKAIADVKGSEIKKLVEEKEALGNEEVGEENTDKVVEDENTNDEDEKITTVQEKQKKVFMSKLHDAIAKKSHDESITVVPSSIDIAKRFISKNFNSMDEVSLIENALARCSFYGNGSKR